jgi:predicted TPR repeat methyltransferase
MRLASLGAADPATRDLHAYVRTLFDQYAPRFDRALEDLGYAAPALLRDAITRHGARFGSMLDLGCGTGLAGAAFRPHVDWLVGVDLSPKMVEQARVKGLYDKLAVADIGQFLAEQRDAAFHLVIAADVFAYVADVPATCAAVARVLAPGGLFGFTVETHDGEGAIVGPKMRYAHGEPFIRGAIADAGLALAELTHVSSRTENRVPVPGLLAVARR